MDFKEKLNILQREKELKAEFEKSTLDSRLVYFYDGLRPLIDFLCYVNFERRYTKNGGQPFLNNGRSEDDLYEKIGQAVFGGKNFEVTFWTSLTDFGHIEVSMNQNLEIVAESRNAVDVNIKFDSLEKLISKISEKLIEEFTPEIF